MVPANRALPFSSRVKAVIVPGSSSVIRKEKASFFSSPKILVVTTSCSIWNRLFAKSATWVSRPSWLRTIMLLTGAG